MRLTLPLHLYRVLMALAAPLLPLYLKKRAKAGKEDLTRLSERYGTASRPRPDGNLIWFHGASVGETMMALPVIKWILSTDKTAHVLVTSGTTTSADMLKTRLPDRAFHQYLPADHFKYARKFLDHWQPDSCLWLESDIWPNILISHKARNTPLVFLNARLSESSRNGWMKRPKTAKVLFNLFDSILPADNETAECLSDILGRDVETIGNLKIVGTPLPVEKDDLNHIKGHLKTRPDIWCAASTHAGEDEIILDAHLEILKQFPEASLILAPRHPERGDDITTLLKNRKLSHARWGEPQSETVSVLLVDQMGKMGAIFRESRVVLMGGSLLPHLKGHNPLEPAHFNCAIMNGPYVSSFQKIYDNMKTLNAAFLLETPDSHHIAERLKLWFQYDGNRSRSAKGAQNFANQNPDLFLKITAHLAPFIFPKSQLD